MSAWLERLKDSPNELLRIAVRGQHLQRWQVSRDEYEEGRQGYLHWRRDQGKRAGETTAARMRQAGYADDDAERVARMIRKEGLGRGGIRPGRGGLRLPRVPGELLCGLLEKVDHDHMVRIVKKTWGKISDRARELALGLPMAPEARGIVEEALAS